MFGWFKPSCPVKPEDKAWVEKRMMWLIQQFGLATIWDVTIVLPTEEFFPDPFDGSDQAIRRLLDRVCGYMKIDPHNVRLNLYSELQSVDLGGGVHVTGDTTAGTYHEEGQVVVSVEASNCDDPLGLVYIMSHELSHAHLLGDQRLSEELEDHEPLTDLTTVIFGMGVFGANSAFREKGWSSMGWSGWNAKKLGYLGQPMFGYALALLAYLRREDKPQWVAHLCTDVRSTVKSALRYLRQTEDCSLAAMRKPA